MINQLPNQQQHTNPIIQQLSKQFSYQFKDRDIALQELNLISQQNSLLKLIQNSINTKNITSFLTQSDDNECLDNQLLKQPISFRRTQQNRASTRNRVVLKTNLLGSHPKKDIVPTVLMSIENALAQVQVKCDNEVYITLLNLFNSHKSLNKRIDQAESMVNSTKEQIKSLQDLKKKYNNLEKKYGEQQMKLKKQDILLSAQKQTGEKDKRQLNNIIERQKILVKNQQAYLLKYKLLNEDLKKYQAKMSIIYKKQQQTIHQIKIVRDLWQRIMESNQLSQQFKHQIYKKCKDQLIKQRNILDQEQNELQKQHQYMIKILDQMNSIHKHD